MKSLLVQSSCSIVVAAATICVCSAASAETIGSPLQSRTFRDGDAGQVYIYAGTSSPFQFNGVASTFSFFDATTAGGMVTPLLFEKIGSTSYRLKGIGTTRLSNEAGIQSYSFDLVAGSDAVAGGSHTFGFTNRAYSVNGNGTLVAGSSTAGVVPYDHPGVNVPVDDWLETANLTTSGPVSLSIGSIVGAGGIPFYNSPAGGRVYSANFTTTVPEPASAVVLGLLVAAAVTRRGR